MQLKEDFVVMKIDNNDNQPSVFRGEQKIVCPVCGYANPKDTLICKMCSNFLDENDD